VKYYFNIKIVTNFIIKHEKYIKMVPCYMGKILRVNLSDRKIAFEEPDDLFYRRYIGGAGFIAYFLLREVPAGIDPLGPENT